MRTPFRLRLIAGLAATLTALTAAHAGATPGPVVIELFTSQGCSSCPPANAAVSALADRPDVLALSFGVTYWDDLGWKDTFASPRFTARQWDYAHGFHRNVVATPQVVVDGRLDSAGQTVRQIDALIQQAKGHRAAEPAIAVSASAVTISVAPSPAGHAQVWLVRYDPRVVQVPIQRGENGGKTLPHRNVVHELTRLGDWTGKAARFPIRASPDPIWKTAILIQSSSGGPILAAAKG